MFRKAFLLSLFSLFCLATPLAVHAQAAAMPVAEQAAMVNINSASAEMIATALNGVGEVRASAIVAYRDQHGPFQTVDDLLLVSGIGEATLEENRARIVLE